MRLPRDIGGNELVALLTRLGYKPTRQTGSHIRLTRHTEGEHHITVPRHSPLKIGTLNSILRDLADHLKISKNELMQQLWGNR